MLFKEWSGSGSVVVKHGGRVRLGGGGEACGGSEQVK